MMAFIDPPGYFAPIQEWREFLREMELAIGRIDGAEEHVAMAKRVIAEKEADAEEEARLNGAEDILRGS
jgi:hypothetical protein